VTTPPPGAQPGIAGAPGRVWGRKDLKTGGDRPAGEFTLGLASLPFIGRTLRRRARLWLVFGLVGLLIGIGFYKKAPPPYQAQITVVLAQPTDVDPLDAVQTDVTLAQSRGVAGVALHNLHLTENLNKFLTSYTIDAETDKVVQFTVGGPTASQALARANALATAFLQYRDHYLEISQHLYTIELKSQIPAAARAAASLHTQLEAVKREPSSSAKTDALAHVTAEYARAAKTLAGLQFDEQNDPVDTQALVSGSYPLGTATAVPRSRFKVPGLYAVAGLIAGLLVGMAYVVVAELTTDKLRRRDDVARALGTPVRLSVGRIPTGRWRSRGLQAVRNREVQRMAAQLRATLPPRNLNATASLVVVAVDDPRVAALPVLSLAVSAARAGSQVIVADLTPEATAAELLGITGPGVRIVAAGGQQIALVVPERGALTPIGPLNRTAEPVRAGVSGPGGAGRRSRGRTFGRDAYSGQGQFRQGYAGPLAAAFETTDLMLTVATLDPALGAEHLPSWASDAVVVLTAGQSSGTKVHGVGEMLRLAGLPPSGAILADADKSDASLGAIATHASQRRPSAHRPTGTRPTGTRPTASKQVTPERRLGATSR